METDRKKITEENLIRCGREEFLEKGITVVDLSLNLSDSLSLADRFLLIQTNGCVREIKKEEFATISRQIPWRHLYRE